MPNVTLYVSEKDQAIVKRAQKLAAFHDDKSLSQLMVEAAKKIVEKYDGAEPDQDGST